MLIWYDLVWNNNLGYVRLNGSYNILKSINFQVAGIPSLCKEKNMNMKSMSYTGKVLWTVWELDVEDYEILFILLIMWLSAMPTWDEMVMSLIYYEDILDDVARDMTLARDLIYGMSRHDKRCEICPGSPAWHCRQGGWATLLDMGEDGTIVDSSDSEHLIRLLLMVTVSHSSLNSESNFLFRVSWVVFVFDVKMLKIFFSGEKTIVLKVFFFKFQTFV